MPLLNHGECTDQAISYPLRLIDGISTILCSFFITVSESPKTCHFIRSAQDRNIPKRQTCNAVKQTWNRLCWQQITATNIERSQQLNSISLLLSCVNHTERLYLYSMVVKSLVYISIPCHYCEHTHSKTTWSMVKYTCILLPDSVLYSSQDTSLICTFVHDLCIFVPCVHYVSMKNMCRSLH